MNQRKKKFVGTFAVFGVAIIATFGQAECHESAVFISDGHLATQSAAFRSTATCDDDVTPSATTDRGCVSCPGIVKPSVGWHADVRKWRCGGQQ